MNLTKNTNEKAKKRDIKLLKKYSKCQYAITGFKRQKYKIKKCLYKFLYLLFKSQSFYKKYEKYKIKLKISK